MPRTYKRKRPDRCVMTSDQLDAAKLLISQGLSKRKAAAEVGVQESTLRKRLKAGSTVTTLGRFLATFTTEQEEEIYNYVKRCDTLYYGLNMTALRTLIYDYAEANKIPHRFNHSLKMAGRDWVYNFLKRHPELKLRQPTQTSIARAMGFNQTQVNTFFDNLQDLCKKYNFHPSRIYNMDECGINTVPKKIPKVFSVKGKKVVGKIVSAERGQTVTIVCAMNSMGNYVAPAFIFPRKRMKDYLLNNAPTGSVGMVSDSGFINTTLFMEYLHHFKENVQPSKENPILLILDNHSSHLSLAAITYCRDNGIHLLTLPPHSSHKMQPLDRSFFGPLKTKFAYECDKWLSSHPGRVIGQTEVASLVNEAFQKVATTGNAIAGFKTSGIWPIDRNIFSEEDFAAASVTDINLSPASSTQPAIFLPSTAASTLASDPASETLPRTANITLPVQLSQECTPSPSLHEQVSELNIETQPTSSALLKLTHCSTKDSSVTDVVATSVSPMSASSSSEKYKPLTSIQPYPKATEQNRRKKGKKSIIATDSPFKAELEKKKEEEDEKIAKKKLKLELKEEKRKSTKNKTKETKVIEKKTEKKAKKTSTINAQKTSEINAKSNKNMDENKENDYFCALCGEKYAHPPTEDWIKCDVCDTWWHEQCTSYVKGRFICDLCEKE